MRQRLRRHKQIAVLLRVILLTETARRADRQKSIIDANCSRALQSVSFSWLSAVELGQLEKSIFVYSCRFDIGLTAEN